MRDQILKLVEQLRVNKGKLEGSSEEATKQGIILPILNCLGWNVFDTDEVFPEYAVGEGRVDYSLRYNDQNKVFIEAKRAGDDLEKHQEQLLGYSFKHGVSLAVLTNGVTWWFYLPLNEGSWEARRFYTIELYEQKIEDIAQRFVDFLCRDDVVSGKALQNAKQVHESRQRRNQILQTLPQAWNRLISEPDEFLVEIIAEATERLCGYKPDDGIVYSFLRKYVQPVESSITTLPPMAPPGPELEPSSYSGKKPIAFTFRGARHEVKHWNEILLNISHIMLQTHAEDFEKVLQIKGDTRPYFTRDQDKLTKQRKRIEGTDIYVETNFSANKAVRISRSVIQLFGYSGDDLLIEVGVGKEAVTPTSLDELLDLASGRGRAIFLDLIDLWKKHGGYVRRRKWQITLKMRCGKPSGASVLALCPQISKQIPTVDTIQPYYSAAKDVPEELMEEYGRRLQAIPHTPWSGKGNWAEIRIDDNLTDEHVEKFKQILQDLFLSSSEATL